METTLNSVFVNLVLHPLIFLTVLAKCFQIQPYITVCTVHCQNKILHITSKLFLTFTVTKKTYPVLVSADSLLLNCYRKAHCKNFSGSTDNSNGAPRCEGIRCANHPLHGDHLYTTQANKLEENSSQLRPVTLVPPWMEDVRNLFKLRSKIWFYSPLLNTNAHGVSDSDLEPDGFALILVGWTRIPGSRRAKMAQKREKRNQCGSETLPTEVSRGFLRLFRLKNLLCTEVWYPKFDAFSAIWLYST